MTRHEKRIEKLETLVKPEWQLQLIYQTGNRYHDQDGKEWTPAELKDWEEPDHHHLVVLRWVGRDADEN